MNKYFKPVLILLLASFTYTSQLSAFAEYTVITSEKTKEELAPGITYEQQIDFTNKGFININILRMDYDDPNVEMALLKSDESISNRATISQFSKTEPTLYGGVNGDFFNYDYHTTIGPMVEDGVVYSSPINDPEFSSFNITKSNQFLVHNWTQTFFRLEKKDYKLAIDYVNKPYFNGNKIILFNTDWSTESRGNTHSGDILEMLVVDNVITEINLNGNPKTIPQNGYVIAAVGSKIKEIQENFDLYEEVNFIKDDSFDAIDFSIGGGTRLLKNGAVVDAFTLAINGRHPRTAIAYTANREVLLVTVDGRSTSYPGVTQLELANILIDLGAVDAINLDGGGSTAMIKKDLSNSQQVTVNRPSDGQQRRVQNGVGFKGSYPIGTLAEMIIEPAYPRVFKNSSVALTYTNFDEYKNKLTLSVTPEWHVIEGKGYFEGNRYHPTSSGIHTIQSTVGDVIATTTIHVLEAIAELKITPSALTLTPGASAKLTAAGVSSDGYFAPINSSNITWLMTGNTGSLTPEGHYISNNINGNGIIRASFNDLETYIPVAVGTETRVIHDFETEFGHFVGYPAEVKGKYSLLSFGEDGSLAGKLEYNFKNSDQTRAAYVDFKENIVLNEVPDKIGLSVFGNYGNNHWLRAKLLDGDGKTHTIDFQQNVSWEGWKNVEAIVPRNISAPLTIKRIYLVETDALLKDSGAIVIDNLTGVFQPTFNEDVPKNVNKIAKLEDFMLFGEPNYVLNASSFGFNTMRKEMIGSTQILKINNKNNGIRKNDYKQWITLLESLKESTSNPLLLIMASSPDFTDKLEEALFYKELEDASKNRNIAIVFPHTMNLYRMERGIELIGLNTTVSSNGLAMILGDKLSFGLTTLAEETSAKAN